MKDTGTILLGDIELPKFAQLYSELHGEKITHNNQSFELSVTHKINQPVYKTSNELFYTNNFGIGWFTDLMLAINNTNDLEIEKLKNKHQGQDLTIQFPENHMFPNQRKYFKKILELIKPKSIKAITNCPFIIQTCTSDEIGLYEGDNTTNWEKQKNWIIQKTK